MRGGSPASPARWAFWVPAVLGVAADLVSKHFAFAFLLATPHKRHPLLGSWLVLQLERNKGGVFGVLQGRGYLFVALTVIALGVVLWMLWATKPEQWLMQLALGLVVAGAVGNLVDRLWFGHVRDFIYIEVIRWPAFNVADMCICVAAGLLAIEILRAEVRERAEAKANAKGKD